MKQNLCKNIFSFSLFLVFSFLIFFNYTFAAIGDGCGGDFDCDKGETCNASTYKCVASATTTSSPTTCPSSQYMVNAGTASSICKDKIDSDSACDYSVTDRNYNGTCKSDYCNTSTKLCENDPNCIGSGKYKLTTGLPFLGLSAGQCVNTDTALDSFLSGILKFIFGSVGTVTVIIIIVAGFMWSFSAGNKNTIITAQKMISNAVIGLVLTLTCGLMLQVVNPSLLDVGSLFTKITPKKINIMGMTEPSAAELAKRTQPGVSCSSSIKSETKAYIQNYEPYATIPYDDTKRKQQCTRVNSSNQTVQETLSWSGCGPTSAAKVLKSLGVNITPKDAAKYASDNGFVSCDKGTSDTLFSSMAEANSLKYEFVKDKESIRTILKAGNPVIALVKGASGTCNEYFAPAGGGHYIVVGCYDSTNNAVAIDDPYVWHNASGGEAPRTSAYFDSLFNCLKYGGVYYIHK